MRMAVSAGIAIAIMASAAHAQSPGSLFGPQYQNPIPSLNLRGLSDDGGLNLQPNVRLSLQIEQQLETERDQRLSTAGPKTQVTVGPHFDITHALVGALQYHWTAGQKPELGWAGLPVRAKIKTNGIYFGFSYRPGAS
jgi:hypothetical protein